MKTNEKNKTDKNKIDMNGQLINNARNSNSTIRKCLNSPFHIKKKPFQSILLCKQKNNKKIQDPNTIFVEPFGPLIVTHPDRKDKIKAPPRKFRFEEEKDGKFTFFCDHKNCSETEYYWKDLGHPKILRHYSKDKNKDKYRKLTGYWEVK